MEREEPEHEHPALEKVAEVVGKVAHFLTDQIYHEPIEVSDHFDDKT